MATLIGLEYLNDINGLIFIESFGAPLVLIITNASLIQLTLRVSLWYFILGTEVGFLSSFQLPLRNTQEWCSFDNIIYYT